jgi:PAS domain S-box-containing protein
MILFGMILVIFAVSATVTSQRIGKTSQQENIASNIAQGASELSYLSNDYLIHRESQQLKRWESRFTSFSSQVASLSVDKQEQQVLVRNIQANTQRLKEVFDSVVSAVRNSPKAKNVELDSAFIQVSWSRMAVQSQALLSDASRLSKLLHQVRDQLRNERTTLIYAMVCLFGTFLLASYMLTYRRILKSIMILQAGAAVIGSGNLDFTIEEKKHDEIGDLSHAFNRMTANLKDVTASRSELEKEVTQRKRAEEDLRQQREWLRVTLSSIGDAVIASDTEGRITFLNPAAVTLTGWQSQEGVGQPIQSVFRIINEKTRESAEDLVGRVLNGKRPVALANDTVLVTKDGREVPIEDSAAPILDARGNVTGAVLVFHDVTAKRRTQAALRESEERFRAVFESSSDCILVWDRQYNYLYANQAAIDHVGTTREKVIGKNIREGLGHLPDFMHLWMGRVDRAFATGESFRVEDAVPVGDRLVHSESQVSPIRDAAGQVFAVGVVYRDITGRKRAEEALREAHDHAAWLARFPDENPNPVMRVSSDGTVLYCNPATGEHPGWSCEVGQLLQNELLPLLGQAMAEGKELQWDVQIGGRFYFVWIAPFPEERYANIYGRDITERKKAEEALRKSEARYRSYIEMTEQLGWTTNAGGEVVEDIPSWRKFTGQSEEEVKGWGWSGALHPDDLEHTARVWRNAVAIRNNYEVEYRIRRYDGVYRDFMARGVPAFDDDGNVREWIGTCIDITERKYAEEALRESEQRLNRAQEIAHLGSWELDLVNNRLTWSDEVYRIFGLQPQEFGATYEAFLEAVHPDDRTSVDAAYSGSVREGRDNYEIEHRVVRKSTDEIRVVHERCEHIRNESGQIIRSIGMVHDITESKRAEEALKQRSSELQKLAETLEERVHERTAELEEANKALRQLSIRLLSAHEEERKRVAGELHDTIGSCLSGIKFKVESVLEETAKTPKAATESLSTIVPVIQEAVEECRRIQMDLRPSMLDDLGLFPTLSWFFRRYQTIYSTIHIEQEMTIEESELPDSLKIVIYRVIQEAMNNAAKHSKADLVRISLRKVHDKMELFVVDNGCGFSVQQRLFQNDSRRGLGLTSMRERTELSGGSFAVESAVGKGTTIRASWRL